jgi:hypothetical protein
MPIFYEYDVPYPVPSDVSVILIYYENDGSATYLWLKTWPTLPLITYSKVARHQIVYRGSKRLVLNAGQMSEGRDIFREVLRWLCIAYDFDSPQQPFPPLRPGDARCIRDNPQVCLKYHRALLSFHLISRAQQPWIKQAMWEASGSATAPDPNWVYVVWTQLLDYDLPFVQKTVRAAAAKWKPENMLADALNGIKEISKHTPELWKMLEKAMDEKHWTGYGNWLICEERDDLVQDVIREPPEDGKHDNAFNFADMMEQEGEELQEERPGSSTKDDLGDDMAGVVE